MAEQKDLEMIVQSVRQDIRLRPLTDADRTSYIELQKELSFSKELYNKESIVKNTWKDMLSENSRRFAVVDAETKAFCGYCGIKDIRKRMLEIEIELLERYQRKGIGYHALASMMKSIAAEYGTEAFMSRVEPDNYASQKLMEKLGGKPNGTRLDIRIEEEDAAAFEERYQSLIDDNIRMVAEKFQVEPQRLLTHVLLYRIPMPSVLASLEKEDQTSCAPKKYMDYEKKISRARTAGTQLAIIETMQEMLDAATEETYEETRSKMIEFLNRKIEKTAARLYEMDEDWEEHYGEFIKDEIKK
ncbi:MAG: GNAT family N-acetyltransferase [Firmicutes bacterium]|nr:GNAT family N-acetyltransferase [Bacillota bacterium]